MKQATFKDWTLTSLDKAFGLKQVWQSKLMDDWEQADVEISEIDNQYIQNLQKLVIRGDEAWNDAELKGKFISPLIMRTNIDDTKIGYFLEHDFSATVRDYQLSGTVDGMIAAGFREPNSPLFSIHKYNCCVEKENTSDAQVLAAMLVAKEMNQNKLPIYGMFVIGLTWNFIILEGNTYNISRDYSASNDDVFNIFKILKILKKIIKTELAT